jgi:hypothetical protein
VKNAGSKDILRGVHEPGPDHRGSKLAAARMDSISNKRKPSWPAFDRARSASLKKLFPDGPVLTTSETRTFDHLLAGRLDWTRR